MSGWAALGEILSGGVKRQAEDEYIPQLQRNGSAFKALEDARRARSMNLAREQFAEQMANSDNPQDRKLGAFLMMSENPDYRRAGLRENPYFEAGQQEIARQAGLLGDAAFEGPMTPERRQRITDVQVAISPEPIKRNTIVDSTAIDPYTIGDVGKPTDIGQMDIKLLGQKLLSEIALATQRNAGADASRARAAKTRDQTENPGKYRAPPREGGKGKPSAQATPPKAAIDHLRKNPQLKPQFDAKYGKGAADRVLGG